MCPTVRLDFSRRFRICTWFGQIRSFHRSNVRQTGCNRSDMAKTPKDQWVMTFDPLFDCIFETISNMCLVWSNSVISSVKCTSNRILTVRYGKNPLRSMSHHMWPTFRLQLTRRFRICAWFGQIRSFYRSNVRQTGFYLSEMSKVPK